MHDKVLEAINKENAVGKFKEDSVVEVQRRGVDQSVFSRVLQKLSKPLTSSLSKIQLNEFADCKVHQVVQPPWLQEGYDIKRRKLES